MKRGEVTPLFGIHRAGRPRGCTRQTPLARLRRDPRLPGGRIRPSGARLDRRGDDAKAHGLAFALRGCQTARRHERPEDIFALEDLTIITKHPLAPVVATEEDLREAFTRLFGTEDDLAITSLPTRVIYL